MHSENLLYYITDVYLALKYKPSPVLVCYIEILLNFILYILKYVPISKIIENNFNVTVF